MGSHKDEMPEDFIERFDFLDYYYADVENEPIWTRKFPLQKQMRGIFEMQKITRNVWNYD